MNNRTNQKGSAAQYDGFSAGEFYTSVNLFRGETKFDYPLVTELPKKNGIGIQISATYSSNTDRISRSDNTNSACGILGLGWGLGYSAVYREESDVIQPPERERYYYCGIDGGTCQLYQTDRKWIVAALQKEDAQELQNECVSERLSGLLTEQGIVVTQGSKIVRNVEVIVIVDDTRRFELAAEQEEDGGYRFYYHGINFEPANFDFSKIVYFPEFEVWYITDKQGIRRVYGGTGNDGELQYRVHYHGQIISSVNKQNQEQAVVAWNLSREETIWGNQVLYHYIQDTKNVGRDGLPYTRACYLSEIVDSYGFSSKFQYEEKRYDDEYKEYIDPNHPYDLMPEEHIECDQARFETKYLTSISTYGPENDLIETITFNYEVMNLSDTCKLKGALAKRLLTSVERKLAKGGCVPPCEFTYETGQEGNLGALKSILTPTGTKVDYEYIQKQLKQCSSRRYEIPTENYSDQKVWNGNQFSAILLYNDVQSTFEIWQWVGRFQKWTPDSGLSRQWTKETEAVVLEDSIVLYDRQPAYHNTQIVWYRKNPDIIGGWSTEICDTCASEYCSIYAQDNWLIVVDQENAQITRYTYNLLNRTTQKTVQTLDRTHYYQVAANGQSYALLDYDIEGVSGNKSTKLNIYCLNGYGQWIEDSSIELPEDTILYREEEHMLASSLAYCGNLCVLANVIRSDTTAIYYDLHIWEVADNFTELYKKSYSINCNQSIWEDQNNLWKPIVNRNLILTGGVLLAYDGANIYENASLSVESFDLTQGVVLHALGKNCMIQSKLTYGDEKKVLAQALIYDPLEAAEFASVKPVTIFQDNPEEIEDGRYVPSITGTIAVFDQKVYDLYEQDSLQHAIAELQDCMSSSVLNMGNSIIYRDRQGSSKYVRIFNGVVMPANGLEGTLPETPNGSNVFTTSKEQCIVMYINTGDSYEEAVSNYSTLFISADNGFTTSGKKYLYNDEQAVCDVSGTSVKFYEVDVIQYPDTGNGYTRYSYYNSLAKVNPENNVPDEYAVDGQLLSTAVCDDDNKILSKTEFNYSIIRKIATHPETERDQAIYGAVMESVTVKTEQDGAESVSTTVFDGFSGEKRETVNTSYNVFGDKTTSKQTVKPAANEYEVLTYQNRLAETGQSIDEWAQNDGEFQTVQMEQYEYSTFDGKSGKVLTADRKLLWKESDNAEENWTELNQIQGINPDGNVVQQKMQTGILQSNLYSENGFYEIGELTNTDVQSDQYYICTFEPYEKIPDVWKSFITEKQSVAGTSSLLIKNGEKVTGFKQALESGEYMVSFWSIGDPDISISGTSVCLSEEMKKEWNGWKYQIKKISVKDKQTVEISFMNDSGNDAFVDIFCIAPFFYPPMVQIYKGRFLDASVCSYGKMTRQIYDRRDYVIGTMDDQHCSLTIPFYRRNAVYHDPEKVLNSELSLSLFGDVYYERNEQEKIQICVKNPDKSTRSSAVYVDVNGNDETHLTFGNVDVSYGSDTWSLTVDGKNQKREGFGCDGEWLLITGSKILFFFNGENLFSANSNIQLEEIELTLSGKSVYRNLICGTGAVYGIQYLNSAGRVQQGQMYQEDKVTVTQYFYDVENRIIAQTKPAVYSGLPYGYQEEFAHLDPVTNTMTGMIADEYPEDEGFPYAGQCYEKTPLGRVIESSLPGAEYAINPAIDRSIRKTSKVSYEPVDIPGLSLDKKNYLYQVTLTPEGKRSVSVLNTQKQQVASAALGSSSAIISAVCNTYQNTCRIQTEYLPAYFEGNHNAVRVKKYDYCGRLVVQKNPDQDGELRYSYSDKDEKRFTQTPEMKNQGKTMYQKYNEFHCVIEEGFCTIPWEEMVTHVNEKEYPNNEIHILRTYEYGTDLKMSGAILNPVKVCVFGEDGTEGVTEFYQYDDEGRIIEKSVQIPGVKEIFTEQCGYDHQDNIVWLKNTSGQLSTFLYDASGRMKEEVLADGKRKTQFSYTANDLIQVQRTEAGTTQYRYTSAGWISEIQSPLLHEQIQYDATRIKEFTVELKQEVEGVPNSIRYLIDYDEFGRLRSTQCYDGDKYLEEISIREVKYDHSGNILTMDMGDRIRNYIYQKDTNKLLSVDEDVFTYDADGSVTSSSGRKIQEIRYENGKPVFVKTEDTSYQILYDTSGNRVMKAGMDQEQTVYLYQNNRLAEKIHISDDQREQYLYGQYGLRSIIEKDKIQDVATDHLGSPRVISEHGKAVAATHYAPFGKELPVIGELEFGFNGYSKETETGLLYSAYRFYDPEIGRFYSLDPKESTESPYVFCGNDPFNKIDPNGDSWWGVLIGAVVGIIGTIAVVATAGAACPALLAAEAPLVAEIAVGSAAGVVGTVSGDLVTAACDKEPITAKMVIGSMVSGAISGLGALAGPAGQGVMKIAMNAGWSAMEVTALGATVGCTVGAAVSVAGTLAYDAITDTPVSATSIITSGLAGLGTGLLSTRAVYGLAKPGGVETMPVMMSDNELGTIIDGRNAVNSIVDGQSVYNYFDTKYNNTNFFSFVDQTSFEGTARTLRDNNINPFSVVTQRGQAPHQANAVIACHGFGQHCFVVTSPRPGKFYYRPIKGSLFVDYVTQNYNLGLNNANDSLKLYICFSGGSPKSIQTAQKFAKALNRTVYATWGASFPWKPNQLYRTFT